MWACPRFDRARRFLDRCCVVCGYRPSTSCVRSSEVSSSGDANRGRGHEFPNPCPTLLATAVARWVRQRAAFRYREPVQLINGHSFTAQVMRSTHPGGSVYCISSATRGAPRNATGAVSIFQVRDICAERHWGGWSARLPGHLGSVSVFVPLYAAARIRRSPSGVR
jgi:hypothetical protein